MSNQYPGPPQQPTPPPGYLQQPPQAPYGAPGGGGGGYPPPQFGAPPTGGGGGGKKLAIILGIVGVLVLLVIAAVVIFLVAGDDDDDPKPKVTQTVTVDPTEGTTDGTTDATDVTTPPTTEVTTTTTDGGTLSPDGAEIIARAYLDSLVTSNCLAVQGLSTPEWFASEYGDQAGCEASGGDAQMSSVEYEFGETVENGDGSVSVDATVADSTDTTGTSYTATWTLVPSPDNTSWLVDSFALADA